MPETDPQPLTTEERQEAERLCANATPGPWAPDVDPRVDGSDQVLYADAKGRLMTLCFMSRRRGSDVESAVDAAFISQAHVGVGRASIRTRCKRK